MKFNPFKIVERIPSVKFRNRALDVMFTVAIPFNRWLGMRLGHVSEEQVTVISPATTLRQNHVGGAHACAIALIGEYAAGLLAAQHYTPDRYRLIIGKLDIDYLKQGKGTLVGTAVAPTEWPKVVDGEGWVDMKTEITNKAGQTVAICKTKWQLKEWGAVGSGKGQSSNSKA